MGYTDDVSKSLFILLRVHEKCFGGTSQRGKQNHFSVFILLPLTAQCIGGNILSRGTPSTSMSLFRRPCTTSKPLSFPLNSATSRRSFRAPHSASSANKMTSDNSNSFKGKGASLFAPRVFSAPAKHHNNFFNSFLIMALINLQAELRRHTHNKLNHENTHVHTQNPKCSGGKGTNDKRKGIATAEQEDRTGQTVGKSRPKNSEGNGTHQTAGSFCRPQTQQLRGCLY